MTVTASHRMNQEVKLMNICFFHPPEYMEVVDLSLKSHSDGCNEAISVATVGVTAALGSYDGRQQLKKMFQ